MPSHELKIQSKRLHMFTTRRLREIYRSTDNSLFLRWHAASLVGENSRRNETKNYLWPTVYTPGLSSYVRTFSECLLLNRDCMNPRVTWSSIVTVELGTRVGAAVLIRSDDVFLEEFQAFPRARLLLHAGVRGMPLA